MDSLWAKIAVVVIVIVAAVVVGRKFLALQGEREPKLEPRTYQDVTRQDDRRLRSEPGAEYALVAELQADDSAVRPKQQVQTERSVETEQQQKEEQVVKQIRPQYKELLPEEQLDAERLLEMAIAERKMARLPGMTYKRMIDYCREIISKHPESIYAAKARRMLGEVPKHYWKRYKITEEEIYPAK